MRDIGINLFTTDLPIKEYAKLIKSIGFTKILHDPAAPEVIKANVEAVLSAGLSFDQLHAPYHTINNMWLDNIESEDTYRELTDTIDCCAEVGAPIATVHLSSGPNPPTITDIGRARYTNLVEYAAKKGITVAFENQRFLFNIAWAFHNFRDASNVGFCWDVGHQACATPNIEFMRLFGDRLVCTHIEDNNCVPGEDLHILPFDGKADFIKAAQQIKESNYKGCLTMEVYPRRDVYGSYTTEAFLERAYNAICRIRDIVDAD